MAISLSSDTKENINSLQEPQDQAVSTRKIPRNAKWLSGDDATLLDSLKTFADGNSADNGTFKSAVFTAAAKALKDSHKTSGGAPKTSKSCSHCWATLSGFGWDETRKIVIASDKVWDDYLEAHSKAKVWCSTPFPLYDDIIVLVDGCHAMGDGALHINSVEHETSPPWPSTLVLDDEDDVFVGEDAILGVADALESVATSFTAPTNFLNDVPSTLKHHLNAIQAVCTDASLSSDECAKVVALFTKDVAIADAYTAISDVPLRSMYIHLELRKM
ncbi:uncharacterized protein BJ212DRAFT_1476722 [Suillus subaureus]|uniref:Myb/SANT-like domain-containing protein n=1 Tax=Suillus subaureus TaxID=48587 RepID=A0A9P7EL00_9AGAM|nr:uncharacterized protein BJ212DRAFT_1476722 [Suillus subaureus]KAG1823872.1 hypothetical protein BJ212DRAFT_1476722 [Suillus subaureus]